MLACFSTCYKHLYTFPSQNIDFCALCSTLVKSNFHLHFTSIFTSIFSPSFFLYRPEILLDFLLIFWGSYLTGYKHLCKLPSKNFDFWSLWSTLEKSNIIDYLLTTFWLLFSSFIFPLQARNFVGFSFNFLRELYTRL